MKRKRFGVLLLLVPVAMFCSACGTTYATDYYKFSGSVIDQQTGAPVKNALVVMAYSVEDLASAAQPYGSWLPWAPSQQSAAYLFGRERRNLRVMFYTDDEGAFTTIWRHDSTVPVLLFIPVGSARLSKLAVLVQSSQGRWLLAQMAGPFSGSPDLLGPLPENLLGRFAVIEQETAMPRVGPLEPQYLRMRHPVERPGEARMRLDKAEELFRMKSYEQARDRFEEAFAMEPDNAMIHLRLVSAYMQAGDTQKAIEQGEAFAAKHPNYGLVHKILADAYRKAGHREKYRRHLIRGMQLDPEFPTLAEEFHREFLAKR